MALELGHMLVRCKSGEDERAGHEWQNAFWHVRKVRLDELFASSADEQYPHSDSSAVRQGGKVAIQSERTFALDVRRRCMLVIEAQSEDWGRESRHHSPASSKDPFSSL